MQNLAGRTVFDLSYFSTHKMNIVRVGPYDDKIMPAAVLYGSAAKKAQCGGQASRYMFDIRDGKGAGEYNR